MNFLLRLCILLVSMISFSAFATKPAENKFISYSETGSGKPLVLIHAFPTDQALWTPQRSELKSFFRVITLDLWGFGQSQEVTGQAVTMSDYAAEVKQLLDQLHIEKAIIGGESMGGYIALAFLENYPERVEGLILSDTQTIADSEEAKAKREANAKKVLEQGTADLIRDFMPKALSPDASIQTQHFLRDILDKQNANGIASALRGMAERHDTTGILANTNVPVLILTGDKDTLISPQQSQNMHAIAKNSRLVLIKNAGHLANLEQPEQWNKAVIDRFHN